jgi:uncharacterized membrane protein
LVVSSLIPHNFSVRTGFVPGPVEHAIAYFAEGVALTIAFPKYKASAAVLLVAGALSLELAQFLVDRHPRFIDALGSSMGGLLGIGLIWLVTVLLTAHRGRQTRRG